MTDAFHRARVNIPNAIIEVKDALKGPIERFRPAMAGLTIPDVSALPQDDRVPAIQALIQDLRRSKQAFIHSQWLQKNASHGTLSGVRITGDSVHEIGQEKMPRKCRISAKKIREKESNRAKFNQLFDNSRMVLK